MIDPKTHISIYTSVTTIYGHEVYYSLVLQNEAIILDFVTILGLIVITVFNTIFFSYYNYSKIKASSHAISRVVYS